MAAPTSSGDDLQRNTSLSSRPLWRDPLRLLAQGFGAGLSPYAPGTLGSLVGVTMYPVLSQVTGDLYLFMVGALVILGIPVCDLASQRLGGGDQPSIVWDEVVGMLLMLAFVPGGWRWLLTGFLVFRFFDILKPWPIRWLEQRLPGGLGIMADDLLAAGYGVVVILLAKVMFGI